MLEKIPVSMTPTYGKNIFNSLDNQKNKKGVSLNQHRFCHKPHLKEKSCKVFKEIVVVRYVGWI